MLSGYTVVVGVTGGIAAYKTLDVISKLKKLGAETRVIMTENATKMVAPITFQTISNNPVVVRMFEEPKQWNVEHVALAEAADLFLVCPATANVIGKIYNGIADDFLTTSIMACAAPKLICPAMNHNMYINPIVQKNLEGLRQLGYHILEPDSGRLACGAIGKGRLPEPDRIVQEVVSILVPERDLEGMRILITAGPTREWIDPVRYISNPSTGKMGYALSAAAANRGATVYLVSGPVALEAPPGVTVKQVETTRQMLDACLKFYPESDVVIGAAAPGDFHPEKVSDHKIKKSGDVIELAFRETPDILKTLGQDKANRVLVGFAAETENLVENAVQKARQKNLDFVCANRVGLSDRGFGSDTNVISIVMPDGTHQEVGPAPKYQIAMAILDKVKSIIG
ncbi:MAG TPA: bifunctional phosphopantothenoylcysteine decarboxylase/phosphopantothenate--cysteine ligase CoaBC [Firmicutes bacterium]|nr:bifunctional phosphopantothenoylcysteine decarboxylase/phosphopantothenate--cysteine ligase CoaBC [Bacillota bacterium]